MRHYHLAAWATDMMRESQDNPRPLGLVWVDCPRSVVSAGLVRALEKQATVHQGLKPPRMSPPASYSAPTATKVSPSAWSSTKS